MKMTTALRFCRAVIGIAALIHVMGPGAVGDETAPKAPSAAPSAAPSSPPAPSAPATPSAAPMQAGAGDPRRGARLFTGEVPLAHGGAPCLACHNVSGIAPLGGGSLGPDLSDVYGSFGATGLASVLATLPFPTMKPIYETRPLTAAEQGDLSALLGSIVKRQARDYTMVAGGLGLAGCVLLLVLAAAVWRHRLRGARGMLKDARNGAGGTTRAR